MLASVGARPGDVLSKRSKPYRPRADEIDAMDDDALLAAMIEEPALIRRPLVVASGRLVTGFDRTQLQSLVESSQGNGQV